MLKGTTHPTTKEEVLSLYVACLYDQIKHLKRGFHWINPLKFIQKVHVAATTHMLVDIGYFKQPDRKNLWYFKQSGYTSALPSGIEEFPIDLIADKVSVQGNIISGQKYIPLRGSDEDTKAV
jgi:hypothetical protein